MRVTTIISAVTLAAASIVSNAGLAATPAIATADLNIRSGPGPEYPVIGAIRYNDETTILGCLNDSVWCEVTYGGQRGWAYSRYLSTELAGNNVVVSDERAQAGIPTVQYEARGATTGATTGVVAGAVVGGPVGAVVGGITGATLGAGATVRVVDPPPEVDTYVVNRPADSVYLDGEVVVGAGLPETVELRTIPNYEYRYVHVNRQPVLVEPRSRRIVYIYR